MSNPYQQSNEHYPVQKPVPLICSFDSEGHMRPIRVRINGEAFTIHSSHEKPSFDHAAVFQCEVEDYGILKPLTLEYRYREHLWLMPK